jgi:hypothetical protein
VHFVGDGGLKTSGCIDISVHFVDTLMCADHSTQTRMPFPGVPAAKANTVAGMLAKAVHSAQACITSGTGRESRTSSGLYRPGKSQTVQYSFNLNVKSSFLLASYTGNPS